MNSKQAYELASKFPEVTVRDHFGSDAFSANKRTFITIWHDSNTVNLRLSPEAQKNFLGIDGEAFMQIENAWGRQGWTSVNLQYVDKADFLKALESAFKYSETKTKKAAQKKKKP